MSSDSVVIVSGARTPMGGLNGELSACSAVDLGTAAIKATVERAGINGTDIDEAIIGCVLPAGLKQGPARLAVLNAGLPESIGCTTINKLCGSGMQATIFAHDMIKAGSCDIAIAGGMESMTNAPHLVLGARNGVGTGARALEDHMFYDGLNDGDSGSPMGCLTQVTANDSGLSREAMDQFAIESLTRAQKAIEEGKLDAETAEVVIKTRKGETVVKYDEQPGKARFDKIPQLRPAFTKDGTITAANASSISDGASALLMMTESEAKKRGLKPMVRIAAHARHSRLPKDFSIAPIGAIEKVLGKTGWSVDEVDLFEINEAFAAVTMLATKEFHLDPAKVNVHGGACAVGHPIGSTGSRIIVSLMHQLEQYGKQKGIAALCIGGGEATAVAIERVA